MKVQLSVAFQASDKYDEIWRDIDVPFAPAIGMEFGGLLAHGGWFYSICVESAVYDIEDELWFVRLNNPYINYAIEGTFADVVAAEWGPLWNIGEQP